MGIEATHDTARRFLEERRRGFWQPTALDRIALDFAARVVARQPRCDLTIAELPLLPTIASADLVPVFHNGNTYAAAVGQIAGTQAVPSTILAYGASFNGSAWIPSATSATIIQMSATQMAYYADTGLTIGTPYTPTLRYFIDNAGNVTANGALNAVSEVLTGNLSVGGSSSLTGNVTASAALSVLGALTLALNPGTAATLNNIFTSPDSSITIAASGNNVTFKVASSPPITSGLVYHCQVNAATTTGTCAFAAPLPGAASVAYGLVAIGSTSFSGISQTCTLTGSGATWPESPKNIISADTANAIAGFTMIGTATGGQTPQIAWSQSALGTENVNLTILAFTS